MFPTSPPAGSRAHVVTFVVVIWTTGGVHPTDLLPPVRDVLPAPGLGSRP